MDNDNDDVLVGIKLSLLGWLTLAQYSMTFKVYIMHNDSSK